MRHKTGVIKFEDDWPGVFFRGDEALAFADLLEKIAPMAPHPYNKEMLRYANMLRKCDVHHVEMTSEQASSSATAAREQQ